MHSILLACDAVVNLLLGIPLMAAPFTVATILGLPRPMSGFYPGILGAVLTGIGIALIIQALKGPHQYAGLGLEGAVCCLCALLAGVVPGALDLDAVFGTDADGLDEVVLALPVEVVVGNLNDLGGDLSLFADVAQ